MLNKVTPTSYAGHIQGNQQPPSHLRTQPKRQNNYLEVSFSLFTVSDKGNPSILVDLINGTPITMTLDTGASISIISEKTYQTQFPQLQLYKSELLLNICILDSL